MKLKEEFITQDIDGVQVMVGVGENAFQGLIRSNETAAEIVDMLKSGTTKEAIVDAFAEKYDAAKEVIETDVEKILEKLRSVGALEE